MSFLYSLVGFLIAIGVLVAVHEFGHFWVARKLGVKVLRFSIGFGKPLWRKVHGEDRTEYVIAAIPLGGYVKMLGENDPDAPVRPEERHRAFDNQPIWKRSLIVAAGPGINFLFALILFVVLALPSEPALKPVLGPVASESILGQQGAKAGDTLISVNDRAVDYFGQHDLYIFNQVLKGQNLRLQIMDAESGAIGSLELDVSEIPIYNINPSFLVRTLGLSPERPEITTELQRVVPDSAAFAAGLQVGDTITEVDGEAVLGWFDLVKKIAGAPEQNLALTVVRGDSKLRISARPAAIETEQGAVGQLGVSPVVLPYRDDQQVVVDRSVYEALTHGAEQTWLMSVVTLRMLWKMVTLQVSHKNISGPITIADFAGQAIQIGLDSYLYILAVISISLGVMNLLPIPMLDGGHLLMYGVEVVGGQRLAQNVFAVGQRLGIVMLLCLMSLAFYNDIFRLLN